VLHPRRESLVTRDGVPTIGVSVDFVKGRGAQRWTNHSRLGPFVGRVVRSFPFVAAGGKKKVDRNCRSVQDFCLAESKPKRQSAERHRGLARDCECNGYGEFLQSTSAADERRRATGDDSRRDKKQSALRVSRIIYERCLGPKVW
jgi:hypothetical protein